MSKRRFVLDECIVQNAVDGCVASLNTILKIIECCDAVVFNADWIEKCYPRICRGVGSTAGLRLLRLFNQAFVTKDKLYQETCDTPPLADESGIHHKDFWLVRLAVATAATVVTVDAPLHAALREKGISCARPDEVV